MEASSSSTGRVRCPTCVRSVKFFCAHCMTIMDPWKNEAPVVSLPLSVDIVFRDGLSKSSAVHAKLLAPQDVRILPWPDLPSFDYDTTVVIFPSEDAVPFKDLPCGGKSIKTVVMLDCPWQKTRSLLEAPEISRLRKVKLLSPPKFSKFWRFHNAGDGCISTLEAIKFIMQEYVDATTSRNSINKHHELEGLMYFFDLLSAYIKEQMVKRNMLGKDGRSFPMDEDEKQRQRDIRGNSTSKRRKAMDNNNEALKV